MQSPAVVPRGIRQRTRLGPTNFLVRAEETALTIEKRL